MALADPLSITIDAAAVSLPRTSMSVNSGAFSAADGSVKETVSHQYGKRNRHLVRVDHRKVAPDPFLSGVNQEYSMAAYVVIDVPRVGYTQAEAKKVIDGLLAQLTASSGSLTTKILGGES